MGSDGAYNPDGPAVQLATASSIFPLHLAECWLRRSMDVAIVAREVQNNFCLENGTQVISPEPHRNAVLRKIGKNIRFFRPLEDLLFKLHRESYRKKTGRSAPDPWEHLFLSHVIDALPTARAALSLRPRFVFGHEIAAYGLATALCRGVPKILMPWGGEIFLSAETSPVFFRLIQFSMEKADLILPASVTAAAHICDRFGIPEAKVQAVPWGVDRSLFRRANDDNRRSICSAYGLPPDATIILNSRRFQPTWGCFVALEAFIQVALMYPGCHFVMFGGLGTELHVQRARERLAVVGISDRFTIFDGDLSLDRCAEVMSISDIFLSLLGKGDMRSWSVVQATAAGGVPIVSDLPEYREMSKSGFSSVFVDPSSVGDVVMALQSLISSPTYLRSMRERNDLFIEMHEDSRKQMDLMMDLILSTCERCAQSPHGHGLYPRDARRTC